MPTSMFSSSLSDGIGSDEEPRVEAEDIKVFWLLLAESSLRLASDG